MKKFFTFILAILLCMADSRSATRGERASNRDKNATVTTASRTQTNRQSVATKSPNSNTVVSRTAQNSARKNATATQSVVSRDANKNTPVRGASRVATIAKRTNQNVTARATTNTAQSTSTKATETRTGAEYEQCKTAFFTCMDQFCTLKNDAFQRCSCSDRVYDFEDISQSYQQASENLTEFVENLDVVGMTYEQGKAMKTASEGEDALTEDKSASKQLLQAIMNAIKGEDSSVGGKYQNLNKITIATDLSNAFGLDDTGQIVASYNGSTLYKAVYPKCKSVVQNDCNKASLQRAINAYLMAVEQDCNTVESALKKQRQTLKYSTHESSALLDLARIENRQKHNTDDIATCIENIEYAITDEEVCGEKYHKCLDYGQFIDVTTGAPLTGVVDFYKLGELLTFKTAENLENQKLSSISNNRDFVKFFENKTKKFAQVALDKCTGKADTAWKEYLDMALIDIYYAQQSKVDEIEQSCFDLVTACYNNQSASIATAMANLTGDYSIMIQPAEIKLTSQLCDNYIESCNNMFNGDIIKTYLANKDSTDSDTACRAIAQQCFDKFGGVGYENFYSPQSGLFTPGRAIDWFSLYDDNNNIVSPCAQELAHTTGCANRDLLERVFGGFDKKIVNDEIVYTVDNIELAQSRSNQNQTDPGTTTVDPGSHHVEDPTNEEDATQTAISTFEDRKIRPRGVASEIYAKIINNLSNQCDGVNGYFVEYQHAKLYGYNTNNFCQLDTTNPLGIYYINEIYNSNRTLNYWYRFIQNENVCPANYSARVDVQSWGACSCWENGGYRSKNGTTETCRPILPISATDGDDEPVCTPTLLSEPLSSNPNENQWCQQPVISSLGQVCPDMQVITSENYALCAYLDGEERKIIDVVLEYVPQHRVTETTMSRIRRLVERLHTTPILVQNEVAER